LNRAKKVKIKVYDSKNQRTLRTPPNRALHHRTELWKYREREMKLSVGSEKPSCNHKL